MTVFGYYYCYYCITGTAFNQLAVLVGNKNEYLDSIYYYQRRYKEWLKYL